MINLDVFRARLEPPYAAAPGIGLVVGTFAAVPYIHLQLESRRRHYPAVPILVHDDASSRRGELARLCEEYGAALTANATRQPPTLGDMTAFASGLDWAGRNGLELLVKVSRRWIFRTDWTASLADLARRSQYATIGSYTTAFDFGFRTECLAMAVSAWSHPLVAERILRPIRERRPIFVEGHLHQIARDLEAVQCEAAETWRASHPMPHERSGYALWEFMGTDRTARLESALWHDSHRPADYHELASSWGLPYALADFADPNQGEGNGA